MSTPTTFDGFFEWLMKWEGERFEDDPNDHGGATKFGIDQASHPDVDIRQLTRDRAKTIYKESYWDAVQADKLPYPLNWILTDIAVNNGKNRAVRWLQQIVDTTVDGLLGPKTHAAVAQFPPSYIGSELLAKREDFYKDIAHGTQAKFLKGWLNRNNDLSKVTNTPLA